MGPKFEGTRAAALAPRRRVYVAYDRATGWQNGHESHTVDAPSLCQKTQLVFSASLDERESSRMGGRRMAKRPKRG
jgi:hypothetical protein